MLEQVGQPVIQPVAHRHRAVGRLRWCDVQDRAFTTSGEDSNREEDRRDCPQRWTTGHVSVRVMPGTPCTFATTSLPSSSTLRASARTMTSYGPVTSSATVTPLISAIAAATAAALPTSVWMRMYAWTVTGLPLDQLPACGTLSNGTVRLKGEGDHRRPRSG